MLEFTSKKGLPIIKISCKITEASMPSIKVDVDFVLDVNNEKYIKYNINKLTKLLSKANIHVTDEDFKNEYTVLEVCKKLIGKKVLVKQGDYNNFKKYYIVDVM